MNHAPHFMQTVSSEPFHYRSSIEACVCCARVHAHGLPALTDGLLTLLKQRHVLQKMWPTSRALEWCFDASQERPQRDFVGSLLPATCRNINCLRLQRCLLFDLCARAFLWPTVLAMRIYSVFPLASTLLALQYTCMKLAALTCICMRLHACWLVFLQTRPLAAGHGYPIPAVQGCVASLHYLVYYSCDSTLPYFACDRCHHPPG
jgi:hypothetical protein